MQPSFPLFASLFTRYLGSEPPKSFPPPPTRSSSAHSSTPSDRGPFLNKTKQRGALPPFLLPSPPSPLLFLAMPQRGNKKSFFSLPLPPSFQPTLFSLLLLPPILFFSLPCAQVNYSHWVAADDAPFFLSFRSPSPSDFIPRFLCALSAPERGSSFPSLFFSSSRPRSPRVLSGKFLSWVCLGMSVLVKQQS